MSLQATTAAALLLVASQIANAPQQFDIKCHGATVFTGNAQQAAPDFRYSIDLGTAKFCTDNCRFGAKDIISVTDEWIFFNRRDRIKPDDTLSFTRLNRKTGKFEASFSTAEGEPAMGVNAVCEQAPFSGIGG